MLPEKGITRCEAFFGAPMPVHSFYYPQPCCRLHKMQFTDRFSVEIPDAMTPIEEEFKKFYLKYPELTLDLPHTIDEAAITDRLKEQPWSNPQMYTDQLLSVEIFDLFVESLDITVSLCKRYFPAYMHLHDFFEILCVFKGKGTLHISDTVIDLRPGDISFIAPGTPHSLSAFYDDSVIMSIMIKCENFERNFFSVVYNQDILGDFFLRALYRDSAYPYVLARNVSSHETINFLGFAYDEFNSDAPLKNRMLISILTAFFISLERKHGNDIMLPAFLKKSYAKKESVLDILNYFHHNFLCISLEQLCTYSNYSERQLQRLLKETTGQSFSANVLRMKMNRARLLLKSTPLPVSKIAEDLGYSDLSNFYRAFKKYYGVNPGDFR